MRSLDDSPEPWDETAALVEALMDALAREALESPLLPPAPVASGARGARLLAALARLGGVASARALATELHAEGGERLDARGVREALRGAAIRRLGAGYLALPQAVEGPVGDWLLGHLRRQGPQSVEVLVADIQARWPHGDPAAIEAWLRQDPPGIVVVDGVARLRGGRGG